MTYPTTTFGMSGGVAIQAVVAPVDAFAKTQRVTLTGDYQRNAPADWPRAGAGAENFSKYTGPQTIPNGTTLVLFVVEAAALIAAGAAIAS